LCYRQPSSKQENIENLLWWQLHLGHRDGDGSGEETTQTDIAGRNDHSGQRAGAEVVVGGGTRDTAADNGVDLGGSVISDKGLRKRDLDRARQTKLQPKKATSAAAINKERPVYI